MIWQSAIVVALGLLVATEDPGKSVSAKAELNKLQGTWTIEEAERDGQRDPAAGGQITISGDHFITKTKKGDKVLREGTLKLDPSKKPATIDATYTQGPDKGKTRLGIYQQKGGNWLLYYRDPGLGRPKSFDTVGEKGRLFLLLKRKKS